jgi:vesicle coat complex subunit
VSNTIDILYSLIRDPDPLVSTNSIMALDEILQEEGGIAINTKMITYLLNRIKVIVEFNIYFRTTMSMDRALYWNWLLNISPRVKMSFLLS